jgi:hypothetical protein
MQDLMLSSSSFEWQTIRAVSSFHNNGLGFVSVKDPTELMTSRVFWAMICA